MDPTSAWREKSYKLKLLKARQCHYNYSKFGDGGLMILLITTFDKVDINTSWKLELELQ